MLTIDIHSNKETVSAALYQLGEAIRLARRDKDKLLCVIVGYGSTGKTHKIRTAVIDELTNLKINNNIKGFICGNNLDLFDPIYHGFEYRDRIPDSEKKKQNKGAIYIVL